VPLSVAHTKQKNTAPGGFCQRERWITFRGVRSY